MTKFGWRELWRISVWAAAASAGLLIAVVAAGTETGRGRLHQAIAEVRELFIPTGAQVARPLDAREGRRLADTVRSLTAEREQLLARVDALEQSLSTITASVARVEKSVQALHQPPEVVAVAPAQPAKPPAEEITGSIQAPADVPLPPAPPATAAQRAEFGLDLGNASSVDALRTAWTTATRRYGSQLEGLHPVVQTRERRQGAADFRLIAGPIGSASAAARICATITAAGGICAPTAFEGQRLAVR